MKNLSLLKVVVVSLLITVGSLSVRSQGAYVSANLGYGFPMSSQAVDGYVNESSGSNSTTQEQIFMSFGKGLNFGGTFGYMFNKNVGAELGISYLMGGKTKATDDYSGGKTDYSFSGNMLRFIPSIVVTAGSDGMNPYARFGFVIGKSSLKQKFEDNDDGDIMKGTLKYSGGMSFGVNAAVGVLFGLNDKMSLFAELNTVNISYAPKKAEFTELTYNGKDQLPDLPTNMKEIEYVDEITYTSTTPPESEPTKQLKTKMPFGSIGINFGVVFKL